MIVTGSIMAAAAVAGGINSYLQGRRGASAAKRAAERTASLMRFEAEIERKQAQRSFVEGQAQGMRVVGASGLDIQGSNVEAMSQYTSRANEWLVQQRRVSEARIESVLAGGKAAAQQLSQQGTAGLVQGLMKAGEQGAKTYSRYQTNLRIQNMGG